METPVSSAAMDFTSSGLPLLTLDDDAPEFDYAAFLQEDDVDYMAEESSTSNTLTESPTNNTHTPQPFPGSSSSRNQSAQPRQRLERRGHTKSRRGCFNCKRRRIKCQETRPACGHCVKTGLKCEYPTVPQIVHQPQHQIPLFSLQDMRFFQHFLMQCVPRHPIGAESIWTHEIPCLSQKYEYLMHAILGYSASELMQDDPSLVTAAMTHRVKAIKAIKKTLSEVPKANTFEEGNALMATCFALTFQSVLLDDGMAEYMTFIRGIIVVAIQMYIKGASFLFANFLGDKQNEFLEPYISKVPPIESSWVDGAVAALQNLEPICRHPLEKTYHTMITDMTEKLYVSSWEAFLSMGKHYGWWMQLSHDEFQHIIDPSNQVCILLATHWIAIKQVMGTILQAEMTATQTAVPQKRADQGVAIGMVRWLKYLNQLVDLDHLAYNQWPLWVESQLDIDRGCFGRTM